VRLFYGNHSGFSRSESTAQKDESMNILGPFVMGSLNILATLFIIAIGISAPFVVSLFVADVGQTKDAIRRDYPVIGRFRYLFIRLGEFLRHHFFAFDREELPFNRAERDWIYRSSAGVDNAVAFGSTRSLTPASTVIFINCPFPTLEEHARDAPELTFGPYTPAPYGCSSFINISAMSFGALSAPAVRALSKGAAMAGCWLNTGEGGVASYHLEGGCDVVFQIGTAKYGVRSADGRLDEVRLSEIAALPQVKMFELKLSQGAKPGKGRILPAAKVTSEIAKIRGIPVQTDSISPRDF
jgi:Conserved region in glutamate synthase